MPRERTQVAQSPTNPGRRAAALPAVRDPRPGGCSSGATTWPGQRTASGRRSATSWPVRSIRCTEVSRSRPSSDRTLRTAAAARAVDREHLVEPARRRPSPRPAPRARSRHTKDGISHDLVDDAPLRHPRRTRCRRRLPRQPPPRRPEASPPPGVALRSSGQPSLGGRLPAPSRRHATTAHDPATTRHVAATRPPTTSCRTASRRRRSPRYQATTMTVRAVPAARKTIADRSATTAPQASRTPAPRRTPAPACRLRADHAAAWRDDGEPVRSWDQARRATRITDTTSTPATTATRRRRHPRRHRRRATTQAGALQVGPTSTRPPAPRRSPGRPAQRATAATATTWATARGPADLRTSSGSASRTAPCASTASDGAPSPSSADPSPCRPAAADQGRGGRSRGSDDARTQPNTVVDAVGVHLPVHRSATTGSGAQADHAPATPNYGFQVGVEVSMKARADRRRRRRPAPPLSTTSTPRPGREDERRAARPRATPTAALTRPPRSRPVRAGWSSSRSGRDQQSDLLAACRVAAADGFVACSARAGRSTARSGALPAGVRADPGEQQASSTTGAGAGPVRARAGRAGRSRRRPRSAACRAADRLAGNLADASRSPRSMTTPWADA